MISFQEKYFVITGTSGTGKTRLLEAVRGLGFLGHDEATRAVLVEQLAIDGPALPAKDPVLFLRAMLKRMEENFSASLGSNSPVFFDRGMPDLIAYAERFGVDRTEFEIASRTFHYNRIVFVLPPWKDIFINDNERRGTFELYGEFHKQIITSYQRLDFELVEVPRAPVEERARFVIDKCRKTLSSL